MRGFAADYKTPVARLGKRKPAELETVLRLVEAIVEALKAIGLTSEDAREAARSAEGLGTLLLAAHAEDEAAHVGLANEAITAARTARDELVAMGMPPSVLPVLADGDRFVASASQLVTALHAYLDRRAGPRLAPWDGRLRQLAGEVPDLYAIEEAARLVELACRWVTARLAHDESSGTMTLTGPLVDPPSPGQLATIHLEGAIALDRWAYEQPNLVGELEFDRMWLEHYPFALHVVATRALERVLGYMAALPMARDSLMRMLRAGDDAHIPSEWIAACQPGERVYLYIASVVIREDCKRSAVKEQLRASFVHALRRLKERGVVLEAILAVGYTRAGRELLRFHGFRVAKALEVQLQLHESAGLLADGRHLYEMVAAVRPSSQLGQLLHDAAFGR